MSDAPKELRDIALDRQELEKRSLNEGTFAAGDVWKDEHNGCWIANIEEVGTGNNHVAAQAVSRDIDEAERRRDVMLAALAAAPASPLPEGVGQCSGITGELDPRLVEWGYTSLDEAITHLGKLLDDHAAFDGLAAPTGDAK